MRAILSTLVLLLLTAQPAKAVAPGQVGCLEGCFALAPVDRHKAYQQRGKKRYAHNHKRRVVAIGPRNQRVEIRARVVEHPAGCPRTRFCGCGASLKVFGKRVRDLYLAANWRRFKPAPPAPGHVAWRYGHVFVIEKVIGQGRVLAWDANSGRGLTRIHVRSLAGYRVVDPKRG